MATVTEMIHDGVYDNHFDRILNAITERKRVLSIEGRATLKPGDIVRFSANINPKYLIGKTATVVRFNRKTVVVDCPNELDYRRFAGSKNVRCPNSMIEGRA